MGRVEYRAEQGHAENDELWTPVIAFQIPDGKEVCFICNISFPTMELAKNASISAYVILSGQQSNVAHSPTGDLKSFNEKDIN